ncbi:uncharacterized protein LOC118746785 isoform X2 [Rhagoletis pomonella]|uniref:uncharacterized protein LOC118746785 isoform X2 n=1 Tax=Rhagoletis pomonella TaxID=28610 RepID=UPI00177C31C3|nr:uncharacterized protein LOC118746785 isoform X2 [Rhagoletis pomonella]
MFIIKATTTNPYPLSLRHLFAFAVLLLTMSPATATATATAATAAANIPLTEQPANAVNGENNLLAKQRHAEGEVVSRGQAVIDMVPMADRTAFVRYELARAINRFNTTTNKSSARAINPRFFLNPNVLLNPTQLMTFENIPTYSGFADDLLLWVQDSFQVTEEDIFGLIDPRRPIRCTANGICFPDDIGILCCPF